ncbi:MAG: hypothetical protein L0215_15960 [Gemmataceae bacterium]|nr:hypothetical protein [Gemmataceae bacterium]
MRSDESEKIRRRMAELRRELDCDVRQVSRSAREMTDWTYYVRKFPWAVAAIALAAGYLVVPKKKAVIKPDPDMLAELVKQNKVRVESAAVRPDKPGMLKSLLMMGITWAARSGIAYMTQRLSEAAQHKAQHTAAHEQQEHEPDTSPLHEPWSSQPG